MAKVGKSIGGAFAAVQAAATKAKAVAPPATSKPTTAGTGRPPGFTGTATAATLGGLNVDSTTSNPAAARDLTQRQSRTAALLTGAASPFAASDDDPERGALYTRGSTGASEDRTDHLVSDPLNEEQRSDLQTPPPFTTDSPPPTVPDLTGQSPTSSQPSPLGGTMDTFVQDGVTYTRHTGTNGQVSTNYEVGGVSYSSTSQADGRSSVVMSQDTDSGLHTRTLDTASNGEVTDTSRSSQVATDPTTGKPTHQSREVVKSPDGTQTTNEEVVRPHGGKAIVTRTMTPDQRVTEVYSYSGDQGSVNRTTNQAADGTAETRTERSYTVDRPIEEMMGSDIPASPTNPHGTIQPLPEKDRSHTSVAQVEIVTSDANGNQTVQHSEETFSQSSRDVQAHGPITSEGAPPQTFPDGTIVPDPDNSITSGGEMTFGEEVVGQFDLGNRDLATELREGKSVTASELLAMASAVGQAGGGTMASGDGVVFKPKNPRGAPVSPGLERMGKAAEVLGLAYGVDSMFHGVLERDPRKILEGFGNVTGGVESMAGAAAALGGRSRLSSGAARLSTFLETKALGSALGKIGPGVSIGTGLWDAYHAETGWDRAAGLMTATSGALMMLGLPGKLAGGVLAIAAIGVGNGDATDTAAFDPRLY